MNSRREHKSILSQVENLRQQRKYLEIKKRLG